MLNVWFIWKIFFSSFFFVSLFVFFQHPFCWPSNWPFVGEMWLFYYVESFRIFFFTLNFIGRFSFSSPSPLLTLNRLNDLCYVYQLNETQIKYIFINLRTKFLLIGSKVSNLNEKRKKYWNWKRKQKQISNFMKENKKFQTFSVQSRNWAAKKVSSIINLIITQEISSSCYWILSFAAAV